MLAAIYTHSAPRFTHTLPLGLSVTLLPKGYLLVCFSLMLECSSPAPTFGSEKYLPPGFPELGYCCLQVWILQDCVGLSFLRNFMRIVTLLGIQAFSLVWGLHALPLSSELGAPGFL